MKAGGRVAEAFIDPGSAAGRKISGIIKRMGSKKVDAGAAYGKKMLDPDIGGASVFMRNALKSGPFTPNTLRDYIIENPGHFDTLTKANQKAIKELADLYATATQKGFINRVRSHIRSGQTILRGLGIAGGGLGIGMGIGEWQSYAIGGLAGNSLLNWAAKEPDVLEYVLRNPPQGWDGHIKGKGGILGDGVTPDVPDEWVNSGKTTAVAGGRATQRAGRTKTQRDPIEALKGTQRSVFDRLNPPRR